LYSGFELWRLGLFSFCGYELALVLFGAMTATRIVLLILSGGGAFDSAKNHKRQRRKRQSITAKREKSQTPKFV